MSQYNDNYNDNDNNYNDSINNYDNQDNYNDFECDDNALNEINVSGYVYKINRDPNTFPVLTDFDDLIPRFSRETGPVLAFKQLKTTGNPVSHLNVLLGAKSASFLNIPGNDTMDDESYYETYVKTKQSHIEHIVKGMYAMAFQAPSPIQAVAMGEIAKGNDVINQSKSGTGKTVAMVGGSLFHLDPEDPSLQIVYMTCSHEVAHQYHKQVVGLVPAGTKVSLTIGNKQGTSVEVSGGFKTQIGTSSMGSGQKSIRQLKEELSHAQIIVCTIGKFNDLLSKHFFSLANLKVFCVDEFDQIVGPSRNSAKFMSTMSTDKQFETIMESVPLGTQKLFFSATVTPESLSVAAKYMKKDPVYKTEPFIVKLKDNDFTLDGIKQFYVESPSYDEKKYILLDLIGLCRITKTIIFVNKVDTAKNVKEFLERNNIPDVELFCGKLSNKEREIAHNNLINSGSRIVVATDVLARGLDIRDVNVVFNFDMPESKETYIHRAGRSGRFGRKGCVINLVLRNDHQNEMRKIHEINTFSDKNKVEELPHDPASIF